MTGRRTLALAALMAALSGAAEARPTLAWPVDCVEGADCFVQQYADMDPAEGALRDPFCGPRAYDGHKGVDIRLRHLGEIDAGVDVLAAAPGVVRGVRDGMADAIYEDADLGGRDCGNLVTIDHGGGWRTVYCHLREGSVAVVRGERVETGARLGEIGSSGKSGFPHLHFGLYRDDAVVDPYTGARLGDACDAAGDGDSFWAEPRESSPGALLDAGFATQPPSLDGLRRGGFRPETIRSGDRFMIFWAQWIGSREGDVMRVRLTAPNGEVLAENETALEKDRATQMLFAGSKRYERAWPEGVYQGRVLILRDGWPLVDDIVEKRVGPPAAPTDDG